MSIDKAIRMKVEWLAYCVEIGFPKTDLNELSAIWDKFKDEHGNLRPQPAPPSTEDQDEMWKELLKIFFGDNLHHIDRNAITKSKSKFILTRK